MMRRWFLGGLLSLWCGAALACSAPTTDGFGTAVTDPSPLSANITTTQTNDIIYVMIKVTNTGVTSTTVTDAGSAGLTFTHHGSLYPVTDNSPAIVDVWYAVSTGILTNETITATAGPSPTDSFRLNILAIHGANTTTPFDTNVSLPAAIATTSGTPNVTTFSLTASTTNACDLLITSLGNTNNVGFTSVVEPTGFTQIGGGISIYMDMAVKALTSTTSSVTYTYSWSNSTHAIMTLDAIQAPSSGAAALGVSNYADGNFAIIQRISQSNQTQNVVVSGTWTGGTIPLGVNCKVGIVAGGTALGFTALTSFSATGTTSGTWTGTLNGIPQGAWYEDTCEDANTLASATQTQEYGVGVVIWMTGASNFGNMTIGTGTFNAYEKIWSPAGSSNPGTSSGWQNPTGEAMAILYNSLQAAQGSTTPIGIVFWWYGGVSIKAYSAAGPPSSYFGFLDVHSTQPVQSDAEVMLLNCGQQDGDSTLSPNPTTFYATDMPQVQGEYQTLTGRSNTTGIFGVAVTGMGGINDLGLTEVRQAQQLYATSNSGAMLVSSNVDYQSSDDLHYNQAGLDHQGYRVAQSIKKWWGLTTPTSIGPTLTSCTISGAVITCAVTQSTGTGLAFEQSGAPYGFYINTSNAPGNVNGGSPLTVSSGSIIDATHFSLTLSTTPSPPVYLSYLYGDYSTVSANNFTAATPSVTGDSVGNPLMPTGTGTIAVNAATVAAGFGRWLWH